MKASALSKAEMIVGVSDTRFCMGGHLESQEFMIEEDTK